MTIYVALLRGINIGGKNRVEMSRLKQLFESAGCRQVMTYINSGNVLFSDDRPAEALKPLLEKAIAEAFKLQISIVLRDQANIQAICKAIPANWTNDGQAKTDVLFLWDAIDDATIIDKIIHDPAIENVLYLPGVLVWNIARQHATRGNTAKLVTNSLYASMTVRNINTVRKLNVLMSQLASAP
jgi:uncharacterized protein (DUF1697 family)